MMKMNIMMKRENLINMMMKKMENLKSMMIKVSFNPIVKLQNQKMILKARIKNQNRGVRKP
jgi:hypothetical protein